MDPEEHRKNSCLLTLRKTPATVFLVFFFVFCETECKIKNKTPGLFTVYFSLQLLPIKTVNKRAMMALGCSPEYH